MLPGKYYRPSVCCRILVFILCICLATGCTTLKSLEPVEAQSVLSRIKPGDTLRLTTRDGKVREFILKEATDRELVGESERVNLSDITDLERREFSTGKTVGLVIGTIVIIAIFQFLRAMSGLVGKQ
ncbi:MAG: hypothetical protein PHF56_23360 [Desulfuromonadaceae bacterium]|nr:hypothetical protein [Desulfuromonadaceae bacterium]